MKVLGYFVDSRGVIFTVFEDGSSNAGKDLRVVVDSDIRYSIEKILKAADEDERKKEIAKELRIMKGMVNKNFKGIMERFCLEDEEK